MSIYGRNSYKLADLKIGILSEIPRSEMEIFYQKLVIGGKFFAGPNKHPDRQQNLEIIIL